MKILIFTALFFYLIPGGKLFSQVQYVNPLIGTNERVISGTGKFDRTDRGKIYPLIMIKIPEL
jgi:hypothetical protein